jgi:hypothetical protein
MCFFNSPDYVNLEQNQHISTLKNVSGRKYYFQKLTQFSQGSKVIDSAASNIGGFLWTDTYVSPTQLNSLLQQPETISILKNVRNRKFFSKANSILTAKPYARCSCL